MALIYGFEFGSGGWRSRGVRVRVRLSYESVESFLGKTGGTEVYCLFLCVVMDMIPLFWFLKKYNSRFNTFLCVPDKCFVSSSFITLISYQRPPLVYCRLSDHHKTINRVVSPNPCRTGERCVSS